MGYIDVDSFRVTVHVDSSHLLRPLEVVNRFAVGRTRRRCIVFTVAELDRIGTVFIEFPNLAHHIARSKLPVKDDRPRRTMRQPNDGPLLLNKELCRLLGSRVYPEKPGAVRSQNVTGILPFKCVEVSKVDL